jgi:hypothetical protein
MNKNIIINEYIEALSNRASQAGDGKFDYFIDFLTLTLNSLNLNESDLELIKLQTKNTTFNK